MPLRMVDNITISERLIIAAHTQSVKACQQPATEKAKLAACLCDAANATHELVHDGLDIAHTLQINLGDLYGSHTHISCIQHSTAQQSTALHSRAYAHAHAQGRSFTCRHLHCAAH